MALNIPLPQQPKAFDAQDLINSIMNNRYNKGILNLQQQSGQRAQQLLPYQIEDYQRKMLEAQTQQNFLNALMGGGPPDQNAGMPADPNMSASSMPAPVNNGYQLTPQEQSATNNRQPGDALTVGQNPSLNGTPLPTDNQNVSAYPQSATQAPSAAPQQTQLPDLAAIHSGLKANLDMGQQQVITPGDPRKTRFDGIAGMTVMGIHVPEIQSTTADGIRYDRYPSGKVMATKIGPAATEQEQSKADIAQSGKIEESMPALLNAANNILTLHNLLVKNPHLTGPAYSAPFGIGQGLARTFGSTDLGKWDETTGDLQSNYAKAQTSGSRGGIGLVNFFQKVKPDKGNNKDYNEGMIQGNAQKVIDAINIEKADWERKNPGKTFPYKIPDLSEILNPPDPLDLAAQDAIARGADPVKVKAKLAQLKAGKK